MEKFTQNDLDYIRDLGKRICDNYQYCDNDCPFYIVERGHGCALTRLKTFLNNKMITTNADKFKEVFGFPLYEVHQLSAQEEGEWLEHEYQEPDKNDDE